MTNSYDAEQEECEVTVCHDPGTIKGSSKVCDDDCKKWKGFRISTNFYQYQDCPDVPEP